MRVAQYHPLCVVQIYDVVSYMGKLGSEPYLKWFFTYAKKGNCSISDDHMDPRLSALLMARSILREVREGFGYADLSA